MLVEVFGGVLLAAFGAIGILWYRSKAKSAEALAIRKEAERSKEQQEHNETLKALQENARRFHDSSERQDEAVAHAQARLREARLARARALHGADLLDAGNRLFGRH